MILKYFYYPQPPTVRLEDAKSRRDDTLLTVDFNLRKRKHSVVQVPQGRYLSKDKVWIDTSRMGSRASVVPAGLAQEHGCFVGCNLKNTVNKVSSLFDFTAFRSGQALRDF